MKDAIDLVNDVRALINIPMITSQITGKVWADERWDDTSKTDVVVSSTGIVNTVIQVGYANVNIYTPSEKLAYGGKDKLYPPRQELKRISNLLIPLIESKVTSTFKTSVDEAGLIMRDTDGSWFMNIRVRYQSLQSNYKNI
ncbi:hypothetical protein [Pedobacter antarcticus]|uniref:hypothetical protein n=1 Tax=Pedobacter antarcticus TaxID=34086 RepID=UPI0029313D74|nr:hypothetical protein [Pedobacter antarcticus]